MRRILLLTAALTTVSVRLATAGPGSASGPITVDSTTFVAGSSVMGTDGGVYSDTLPPIASTTTAAFRMTKYRAQHVNLRDNSGAEIGTSGNPLFTTASSTITIGNVTITNSSFSVTGSSVTVAQPTAANLNATVVQGTASNLKVSAFIAGSSNTVQSQQSGTWNVNNTSVNVATVTISGTPNVSVTNNPVLGVGTNNIGTVTGSSVTIPGTVNTRQVNVSTVIVQSMPAISVSLSTVTITNSSFSIVGVSSVTVMNPTLTVQLTGSTPAGANNIGTVSGSTVTIGNSSIAISNTPNVNVLSAINSTPANFKASMYIAGSSNTVTATQATASSLKASVLIDASSNTVQAQQSGVWTTTATQTTPANLKASVYINGSSNTVSQGGAPWSQNITQVAGNAISGSSIPVTGTLTVTGSSTTAAVAAYQAGTWTNTVTQGTPANLQTSASINGSSNTVQAQQSGAWTATATQTSPASLQASVSINGSSNTVAAAQSGAWSATVVQPTASSLKASVLLDGTSNQVYVTNVTTSPIQVQNGAGTLVGVGWQTGGSSVPVHEIGTASVSVANTPTVTLGTGTNNVGTVTGSTVTIVTSGGGNLPISGTVTANAGTGTFSTTGSSVTIFTSAGGNLPVSAAQSGTWTTNDVQSGTRWAVAFSTTSTTAVLSSTATSSSVAISTPVAGLSSQTVRVFRLTLSVDAATTITFRDGSTNFGESFYMTANGALVLDLSNEPWYITSASNGFVIKQSGSANIGVRIWYTQS